MLAGTLHSPEPHLLRPYVGRFAPSPTGPLHAGSLVAALASWLDARAHGGRWLVRIEDVDRTRCQPAWADHILTQLAALGLEPDEEPIWQSKRDALYQQKLDQLVQAGLAYPCLCSRREVQVRLRAAGLAPERHGDLLYPGTCRPGSNEPAHPSKAAQPAWRFMSRTVEATSPDGTSAWDDFVLKRSDGCFTYQLAVVVDDAAQGVTCVVRGADLLEQTPRQIRLQQALGLPTPQHLHTPLVLAQDGQKLSKQNGAQELNLSAPLVALNAAARALGLVPAPIGTGLAPALSGWVRPWMEQRPRFLQSWGEHQS
jgi:glutamyl-Q tRNA(Asp) synthetase